MKDLLEPGQTFAGRYRIEKFLAKGGFGAVYIAEQISTELRVAVKVLWPQVISSSAGAVEKFKLEARIAGRVNSDHIVRVFDAGFDDVTQMPFLVMELLQGSDLEHIVAADGALAPERVITYMRHAASGLDRAHGYVDRDGRPAPIVHRDLKPENLFLTYREDGSPCIKILDFGIAKVLSGTTKMSQEVKGTPLYMAYEQAAAGEITARTDIWALGLIVYYLLSGKSYWRTANLEEGSITQLFGEVLAMPIVAPTERAREFGLSPSWPPAFDAWFLRCVARDPAERFATAGEAVTSLARVFGAPETEVSVGAFNAFAPTIAGEDPRAISAAALQHVDALTLQSAGSSPAMASSAVGASTDASLAMGSTAARPEPGKGGVVGIAIAAVLAVSAIAAIVVLVVLKSDKTAAVAEPVAVPAAVIAAPAPAPAPTPSAVTTVSPSLAEAPVPASASAAPPAVVPTSNAVPRTASGSPQGTQGSAKPHAAETGSKRRTEGVYDER